MADDTTTAPPVKPGYKTTEFWLTFAAMVITTLYASGVIASDASNLGKALALIAGVLTSLGYSVVRGKVKTA